MTTDGAGAAANRDLILGQTSGLGRGLVLMTKNNSGTSRPYTPEDFVGTWRVYSQRVEWKAVSSTTEVGALIFDRDGALLTGTLQDAEIPPHSTTLTAGNLTIASSNGSVSGILSTGASGNRYVIRGTMRPARDLVTGVLTRQSATGQTLDYGALTLVRDITLFDLGSAEYSIGEGQPVTMNVLRTGDQHDTVTVDWSVGGATASDFLDAPSGTLVFGPNVQSLPITLRTIGNHTIDGNRQWTVALSNPTGSGATLGAHTVATLRMTDDDTVGTFRLSADAYPVREADGAVAITVVRSGTNLAAGVVVQFSVTDGTAVAGRDYGAPSVTSMTFDTTEMSKRVSIPILGNSVVDGSRAFTVRLTSASANGVAGTIASPASATVTITDDDIGGTLQFSAASYAVRQGGTSTITIVRSGGGADGVLIDYTVRDGTARLGTNYQSAPTGTLRFGAGATSASFSITTMDSPGIGGDRTVMLSLGNARSAAGFVGPGASVPTVGTLSQAVLTITEAANAIVQSFNGPAAVVAGSTVSVSAKVQNVGRGAVGPSSLKVYMSADNLPMTLMASMPVAQLSAGTATPLLTSSVEIPSGMSPRTYVLSAVAENTRTINLNVVLANLAVTSVRATPAAVAPGQNVSVTHAVQNRAQASMPRSVSRLFLGSSGTFDAAVMPLMTVGVSPLTSGASTSITTPVQISPSTPAGLYWILARANDDGRYPQSPGADNTGHTSGPIIVGPDILVTAASTITGTSPGQNVTVSYTLKNQGGQATNAFDVGFTLVPETGGPEVLLATVRTGVNLGPGNLRPLTDIVTIPGDTVPGSYRIRVIADVNAAVREASKDNNTRPTGVLSIVRPDLTVPSVTFTPLAVAPGQNVSVTHTVRNVARAPGSALASQSHVYLTTLSASIASSIADFGLASVPPIPPLTAKPVTSKVTIPANTPSGLYFFTVAADASPSIQEQDESNNIGSSATRLIVGPDILVTAASTVAGTSPGLNITISYAIKNQGGQATGAFDVGFALVSQSGGPEVRLDAMRSGVALGPASVLSSTTIIAIPGDTAPGAYRIRVIGDVNAAVNEADEGNNTKLTGVLNIAPRP